MKTEKAITNVVMKTPKFGLKKRRLSSLLLLSAVLKVLNNALKQANELKTHRSEEKIKAMCLSLLSGSIIYIQNCTKDSRIKT